MMFSFGDDPLLVPKYHLYTASTINQDLHAANDRAGRFGKEESHVCHVRGFDKPSDRDSLTLGLDDLRRNRSLAIPANLFGRGVLPKVGQMVLKRSWSRANSRAMDLVAEKTLALVALYHGIGARESSMGFHNGIGGVLGDPAQNIHGQSLANLLEGDLFWDIPSAAGDMSLGHY
ncbi:hypothetical protein BO78DRAFT_431916 [Aspergillus sclerotiicarbonarius CBS 121057]|uniref:Uncharacterized protein n=1 Tax=Aspergillus sclerotiicarbonarius (strain CBS 121057 / IBT 28362) TaxID=1448318 RepID=A0A319E6B7_ASPSB|nr:hypothetical protein BO78DRAFT_431916 [Aspergillus sclerotiicarbonarius CBS 121057]